MLKVVCHSERSEETEERASRTYFLGIANGLFIVSLK